MTPLRSAAWLLAYLVLVFVLLVPYSLHLDALLHECW